ncbi:MAG: lytic transglycosylase domain-containing protein, partial [Rikenellaceae bacterium]
MKYVVTLFFILLLSPSMARSWGEESPDFRNSKTNNLDSLVVSFYNDNLFQSYSDFAGEFILNDSTFVASSRNVPDSVYIKRLGMLNSAIHLPYNNVVRNYITVYTNPKGSFKYILGRAQYYMPIFEEELFRNNMPTELKMLPVIESALNPTAMSPMGAAGLWQFMYSTGKYYGLKQDSFIDQRLDPRAATRAACRYLKDLYRIYGDWTLALAAYNCGPGNVNKALARASNAKSYWDIYY